MRILPETEEMFVSITLHPHTTNTDIFPRLYYYWYYLAVIILHFQYLYKVFMFILCCCLCQ